MDVFWLEQTEADIAEGTEWLSEAETAVLDGLRFPKRRADWRLGRWTAKHAVSAILGAGNRIHDLAAIEIRPAPSGAPGVYIHHRPAPLAISLSHREGVGACAVGPSGVALGCDLELIEPRTNAFVTCFLTPMEHSLVDQSPKRDVTTALLWSAKESALKALEQGLRLDTRSVEINAPVNGGIPGLWCPLSAARIGGPLFSGWWRQKGRYVETLLGLPAPTEPVCLTPRFTRAESSSLSVVRC